MFLQLNHQSNSRRGSVIALLAVLIPVLLVLASYAINVAYIEAVQADVQIVTDVAVQAAGRTYIRTDDRNAALLAAQDAASRNPVSGEIIPIALTDLEFGVSRRTSNESSYNFIPIGADQAGNSVRLTTISLSDAGAPLLKPVFPTMGVNVEIRPRRTAISTQSTMDVALVIDRSGSMAYGADEVSSDPNILPAAAFPGWWYGDPVPANSRWLDLVASIQAFNQQLTDSPQREKVSLSTYAGESSTDQVLTYDYNAIMNRLNDISVQFDGGSTAIGRGLEEGLAALTDQSVNRPYAVRVMVLLTDGIHNTGGSPEAAANSLQNAGVTLFTITFSSEADQVRMRELANSCGGEHFHATDAAQLSNAFQEIAKRLPSLMTL